MLIQKYTILLIAICGTLTISQSAFGNFTEDFNSASLDPLWSISGEGHTGINNGSYVFSDAKDNDGTELYRKIQIVPSGSFKTTLTTTFKKFTSPNTKTAMTWSLNGHNGSVSIIYNSYGKLELRHNDFDGQNEGLATIDNMAISDGSTVTFTLQYNSDNDTLKANYSENGNVVEIYNGKGASDSAFEDFFSLRTTAKLFKFSESPIDQATVLIDEWNMSDSL